MINFYNQVPSIYTSASRDFQYLSWLINIVLNSVKHNIDDLYNLPINKSDPRLAELLALTLGFKVRRNYDQEQLIALVSIIPSILKYKGTIKAIEMSANALIAASGAEGSFLYVEDDNINPINDNCLKIILPENLIDITLFIDLLPYILPAGLTCIIERKNISTKGTQTELTQDDTLQAKWVEDLSWDHTKHASTGLSELFNAGEATDVTFENWTLVPDEVDESGNKLYTLTTGLLDNTVIPVLPSVLLDHSPTSEQDYQEPGQTEEQTDDLEEGEQD